MFARFVMSLCLMLLHLEGSLAATTAGDARVVTKGVVVESVGEGSSLAEAGVRPGDVLLSWYRPPNPPANPKEDHGEIESVFHLRWVALEQVPRGTVTLVGERDGESFELEVSSGLWQYRIRPALSQPAHLSYQGGNMLIEGGAIAAGVAKLEELANTSDLKHVRSWVWSRISEAWLEGNEWEKSLAACHAAVEESEGPVVQWGVVEHCAVIAEKRGELAAAQDFFLKLRNLASESFGEVSLVAASAVDYLGTIAWKRDEIADAMRYHTWAYEVRQRLAPDSLILASSLNNLGTVAWKQGDLEKTLFYYQQSREIVERYSPDSLDLATVLNNLGGVAWAQGNLRDAQRYLQGSLDIVKGLAPGSADVARSLGNLGVVASSRGDFDVANSHYRQALEIYREISPDSLDVATALHNLGTLNATRGELESSSRYHEQALTLQKKMAPGSLQVAASFNAMGHLAEKRGDLHAALSFHLKAYSIRERLSPDSAALAESLHNLGSSLHGLGDLDGADEKYRRALDINRRIVRNDLHVATNLVNLGTLAEDRGDIEGARGYYARALEIREKVAPRSLDLARVLYKMGDFSLREDVRTAAGYFDRSIAVLEAQILRVGGSQGLKGRFRSQWIAFYRNSMSAHLRLGEAEIAFQVLERSRGRSFLDLLAERDVAFNTAFPDLDRRRRGLGVRYDRTLKKLEKLSGDRRGAELEALLEQLQEIHHQRDELAAEIRRASPRLGAIHYPQALTFKEARESLDPGTVMITYSVADRYTTLFTVSRDKALETRTLEVSREDLTGRIQRFHQQLHGRDQKRLAASRKALGRFFYDQLIAPAEDALADAERVVLVPDGPLHRLPFAALVRPDGRYLVEWKPLHSVLSATVYAQLRADRPDGEERRSVDLAIFGDPRYPGEDVVAAPEEIADVRLRSAIERGVFDFTPLPHSRREVESVAALFPEGRVRGFLGKDATEENVKALDKDVRIVHFATHATVDDRFPLNSALALSIPEKFVEGRDNGLLQAWEIFESVRLDADLVVLSACETGLGETLDGEGIIGLTRAFQYAGARTVASSLWRVSDAATAELMTRFYRHLRTGKTKDEALRAAQVELIRGEAGEAFSAPYAWAAFQLIGDWR